MPKFERRHYRDMAAVANRQLRKLDRKLEREGHGPHSQGYNDAILDMVDAMAYLFSRDNHRFDRDKFMNAVREGLA